MELGKKFLKNKVAIVTGGSKGIGQGIVKTLRGYGAKIVVADIDSGKTKENFFRCDVSSFEDCQKMSDFVLKKFGRIDILINNAGIFPAKPIEEINEEDWKRLMGVNLDGVFNCMKTVIPKMKRQKQGKIVNITSIAAHVGFQGLSHYCASKSGILGFTRSSALELAPLGINVNAVSPGAITTPGSSKILKGDMKKQMLSTIPKGRIGKPEDIAEAVAFLSSEAADYITGQEIVVDGGFILH